MSHSTRGTSWTFLVWCLLGGAAAAQCPTENCDPARLARRSLAATRLQGEPPVVDGILDDAAWASAEIAADFVEASPHPAAPASLRSEARAVADDQAVYFALRYFDPEPGRIIAPLARRDDETTSDWAFVEIDCRHDRRSGFSFGVNPRGLQADGAWLSDNEYDGSWNAVWQGAARIDADGWTAELRIPFSQLPFRLDSGAEALVWGINFYRYSPGHGESSNWSPRYRGLGGVVSHFNELRVPAPRGVRRFDVSPYVAGRADDDPASSEDALSAGADLRVGLGSNFSLTATVLPDFGQVEADPSQVNLRSFELFQPEQRPFFLEGLDLYRLDTSLGFTSRDASFASESPFYSRRIGRPPRGGMPPGAALVSMPETTTLETAAKLSGQTGSGWTLGAFSALTGDEEASIRFGEGSAQDWPVEQRSLTTVARARRGFRDGRTLLGLYLADLERAGHPEVLAAQEVDRAAAAGLELEHRFGAEDGYRARLFALGSRLEGRAEAIRLIGESPHHYFQRPDAERLHDELDGTSLDGYEGEARIGRLAGALTWDFSARAVSPGFDVNEAGFQRFSDWLLAAGSWQYAHLRPVHGLRAWAVGSRNIGAGWTFSGESRARVVDAYGTLDTMTYRHYELAVAREWTGLSTDWLQGGPALLLPQRTSWNASATTPTNRPTQATLALGWSREPASDSQSWSVSPFVNVRSSDRLQWSIGVGRQQDEVGWQFLGRSPDVPEGTNVVARVRQRTLSLTLRADFSFTSRLALQLYLNPFASLGTYDRYQQLVAPRDPSPGQRFQPLSAEQASVENGELVLDFDADGTPDGAIALPDGEQRELNGSLVLRWEYHPGSFLTAVWNQQREAFAATASGSLSAIGSLRSDPATNVLLLKVSRRFGG